MIDWVIDSEGTEVVGRLIKIGIIGICVYIVAVPEGLPLAISISMALSIGALKQDEILIKTLQAVQNCGLLHDICVGKTGTLTKGRGMRVAKYHLFRREACLPPTPESDPSAGDAKGKKTNEAASKGVIVVDPTYFTKELKMRKACRDLIIDSIVGNTNAWLSDPVASLDGVGPRYEVRG